MFGLAAIPAAALFTGVFFQRESPHWLIAQGREDEARDVLRRVRVATDIDMTLVAIRLLDRVGRRPLLLWGTAGMAVALIAMAVCFLGSDQLSGTAAIVAIGALLVYTASFAIGLGPVFWLLISEIYPVRARGQAMSVATLANWGANFVVTISFLTLLGAIHGSGTFFLFAALTVCALIYFQAKVPETKNRSLQEIERDLRTEAPVRVQARPVT